MKLTYTYDHYCRQAEIEERVKGLKEKYPDLFDYEYILTTPDGHHIIWTTLTNHATGSDKDKPAFYIDGNTHAGEVTGMMAALHTMDALLAGYGEDKEITFILDHMAVYIVPCVSPDGSETYLSTPYRLRSVNRAYYEAGDGLQQEDIDHDGAIRMMRVASPYGAWKKDPEREDVMVRRGISDVEGEFYQIYTEGEIAGYDGLNVPMQKEKWGRDFNRNYPYGWFPEYRQPGAGELPLINPETRAMAEAIIAHPNIGSVATNHTSGGILLKVPGTHPEKKAPRADMELLGAIGEVGKKITGYDHINIFDAFTIDPENYASGAFDDYCYETQGIYAMTLELWNLDERCGLKHFWDEDPKHRTPDSDKFAKRLAWVRENAPEYFLPWREFDHPQLGKVEIGGFDFKFTMQNPPEKLLAQECEKITAFMVKWALAMPRLVIDSVTAEDAGDGLFRIEAIVSNAGYLPTYLSEKAKTLKVAKGVKVAIDGADIVLGDATQDIGDLSSYGLIRTGARFYGNIGTETSPAVSKKVTWITRGKPQSVTVTASTPKGGKVSLTVRP